MSDGENRTKIVGTLGPASATVGVMRQLLAAGMNVARVNFSHGDAEHNIGLMRNARQAASEEGVELAIMQDLQGPKLRIGALSEGGLRLLDGSTVRLRVGTDEAEEAVIPVPYEHLHEDVSRGDRLLLQDGKIELEVLDVNGRVVTARIIVGGTVFGYQGLAVPTERLSVEVISEKDKDDLALGLKQGVDFVAQSFVRGKEDVVQLKDLIARLLPKDVESPGVVVKIEKHEAYENLSDILEIADAVMVARGDLGLETALGSVPALQKEIIARCLVAGVPVIVATHMLSSMTQSPRPTRAEVSDVANAVIDHTDAVMLSEETAMGKYPVKSMETMAEIVARTEETSLDHLLPDPAAAGESVPFALGAAAVRLARQIEAKAIVVTTRSGYSARAIVRFRPHVPLYAATDGVVVARRLRLSWGVQPIAAQGYEDPEEMLRTSLDFLLSDKKITAGDKVVVVSGLKREDGFDSTLRVVEV